MLSTPTRPPKGSFPQKHFKDDRKRHPNHIGPRVKTPQYIERLLEKLRKISPPLNGTIAMKQKEEGNKPLIDVVMTEGQKVAREVIGGKIKVPIKIVYKNGHCIKICK